jgi:phosphate transport system substrate-binding protein
MNNGVCTNLPSLCSKAASKESIVMSTPDARCPECNASLMVAGGNSRNATNTKLIISVLVGLLVLALGAFFFLKGNSSDDDPCGYGHHATALHVPTRSAATPPVRLEHAWCIPCARAGGGLPEAGGLWGISAPSGQGP